MKNLAAVFAFFMMLFGSLATTEVFSQVPAFGPGQQSPQASSLRNPVFNSGEFQNGPQVAPVSLTTPARVLNRTVGPIGDRQIRVNIRFLTVDDETREALYLQLGESVKTKTQRIPLTDSETQMTAQVDRGSHLRSSRQVLTTSCVSTCLLTTEIVQELLGQVRESKASTITAAPSIILFDGQDGQLNEMVQRPFVVDVPKKVDPNLPAPPTPKTNPVIQVLDEGTALRVKATSRSVDRLHLVMDLTYTRILDFRTQRVFGLGPTNASIQVPMHQVETASAAEEMAYGQMLLIDPYVASETEVREERGVPILGKIPYINRSFKNVAMAKVKTNLMVLVEPVLMEKK